MADVIEDRTALITEETETPNGSCTATGLLQTPVEGESKGGRIRYQCCEILGILESISIGYYRNDYYSYPTATECT